MCNEAEGRRLDRGIYRTMIYRRSIVNCPSCAQMSDRQAFGSWRRGSQLHTSMGSATTPTMKAIMNGATKSIQYSSCTSELGRESTNRPMAKVAIDATTTTARVFL